MINEELKKFLEYSKDNEEVKEKLAQVGSSQEVVDYAKELGFEFTIEDLKKLGEELLKQKDELTDEELEKIAGGFATGTIAILALVAAIGVGAGVVAGAGAGAAGGGVAVAGLTSKAF